MTQHNIVQQREEAKALHQRGEFRRAKASYESLLHLHGEDADTLGLFALCIFQLGEKERAFALWRRAGLLSAGSRIAWRNSNNLLGAALTVQDEIDVSDALTMSIRPWGADETPTSADVLLAQSLMAALERIDRIGDIDALLPGFITHLDFGETEVLVLLRWALEKKVGEATRVAILEKLDQAGGDNLELLLLRGVCLFMAGDVTKSEQIAAAVAAKAPVYAMPQSLRQKFTIAVLNRPPPAVYRPMSLAEFHFNENTPASLVKQMSDDLRMLSFFPGGTQNPIPPVLDPQPDVVINNWATAEILSMPGALQTVTRALALVATPVLNAPQQVVLTTRQRNAETLQGTKGVVVPKIARFQIWPGNEITIALLLEREIGYPLILREPFQQMGDGIMKIDTPEQLLAALARLGTGEFYAITFIDNPLSPSLYRKYRAAVIGARIFISHVQFGTSWNVHRIKDEDLRRSIEDRAHAVPCARSLLDDANAPANLPVLRALEALRRKIPLDIFGIDFDVTPDGRMLFFEANAAMNLSFSTSRGNTAVRNDMRAAMLELIESKVQGTASAKPTNT